MKACTPLPRSLWQAIICRVEDTLYLLKEVRQTSVGQVLQRQAWKGREECV